VVTIDDVRSFALRLPRTTEALVRDRVKFRVDRIVYLAFSRDETLMGFAFPKEEREALVRSYPDRFLMPERSDLRYHWVLVRLEAIDTAEMRELVLDPWRMVVPKGVRRGLRRPRPLRCGRHHGAHGPAAELPGRSDLRTTGRVGLRRATSRNPARSYIDFAPKNMESGWLRSSLSTG
jgi:hypothetical protein